MNIYVDVIDPPMVIRDRTFTEPVHLIGRGTLGRVLFTTHDVLVEHCTFVYEQTPTKQSPMLDVDVNHSVVQYCWFGPASRLPA